MSPGLLVSLPFILLLLLSKGVSTRSPKPTSPKPSIETVIDLLSSQDDDLGSQDDAIIIVCKKKH